MHTLPHAPRSARRLMPLGATLAALLTLTSACATTGQASADKRAADAAMQQRLEEVERTNGRLAVRVEELEDQVFLLSDRLESQRIALQQRDPAYARAPLAPRPISESYYYDDSGDGSGVAGSHRATKPVARKPVQRIALAERQTDDERAYTAQVDMEARSPQVGASRAEEMEEIVISEDEYRSFFGDPSPRAAASTRAAAGEGGGGGRLAQPSVTDEKLGAAPQGQAAAQVPRAAASAPSSSGLQLYKDSLAAYHAGDYTGALLGFETFLRSGPKADYIDNALYWMGECHYGMGRFDQAIAHFERVLKEQPHGNKVPDAMLKMSLAFEQQGESERAKQLLLDLTRRYPETHAASLGTKRLATLASP